MSARMNLRIRLGPLVMLEISGESCEEIRHALKGFDLLNREIDAMCSDLADRMYPEDQESPTQSGFEEQP
ncbi:MAG: hypothetical protein EPN14_09345 [Gallionella sp.]|nr:MAG: hypothetical protein EPN14_09345 [Gallionella sp.]